MSCVGSVGKSQSGVCRRTSISSFEWVWIGMQHPENHCEFGWDFQVPVYPPQRFSGNYGKQGLFSQDPWDASSLCRTCSSEVFGRFPKKKPDHDVFRAPHVDFTHLVPYYLHGDGGRTYKKGFNFDMLYVSCAWWGDILEPCWSLSCARPASENEGPKAKARTWRQHRPRFWGRHQLTG